MLYLKDLNTIGNNLVYFDSDSDKINEHYDILILIDYIYVNKSYEKCDHLNISNKWLIYIDKEINIIELIDNDDEKYNYLIIPFHNNNGTIKYGNISRNISKIDNENILKTDKNIAFYRKLKESAYVYLDVFFGNVSVRFITKTGLSRHYNFEDIIEYEQLFNCILLKK